MDDDIEDIPNFLRVENRVPISKEREDELRALARPERRERRKPWGLPKSLDAVARGLAKEEARARKERQAARLAALKERRK